MIENCPAGMVEQGKALEKRAMDAFAKALAAYSNASGGEDLAEAEAADESD